MSPGKDDLQHRIRAAQKRHAIQTDGKPGKGSVGTGLGAGLRIAADLVAGIAVGTGLGYATDYWLGTLPFGMLIGFFLGCGAGFMNVIRTAKRMDEEARERKRAALEDAAHGASGASETERETGRGDRA